MKLDLIDRRLLSLLQRNSRLSIEQLAHDVGSSRSAVQRRLDRLRKKGVVQQDVSILNRAAIDRFETFLVHLAIRRERLDLFDGFMDLMRSLPEVQQCYVTTGGLNCVAIVLVPDTEALESFLTEHLGDSPFVRRYRTRLVTREVKVGLTVPIVTPPEVLGVPRT